MKTSKVLYLILLAGSGLALYWFLSRSRAGLTAQTGVTTQAQQQAKQQLGSLLDTALNSGASSGGSMGIRAWTKAEIDAMSPEMRAAVLGGQIMT